MPWRPVLGAVCCGLLLSACGSGSGSGSGGTGSLSVALTDAPVDGVSQVWVEFTGVQVKPSNGPAIDFPFDAPLDVDLLTLTSGNSTTLLNGEKLPAGRYDWIALEVNAAADTVMDSYVMDDSGNMVELSIPSGAQQGLRLVSGFTVLAGATTSFMVDWDLRKALTNPVGQQGYFLRPALRITDTAQYGTISGTVDDALLTDSSCNNDLAEDKGNLVYVYEGADVVPVDIDGMSVEPLTTARVAQDAQAAGAYTYSASFLPPGDYTVAFTCQGLADDPETADAITFVGAQNVSVSVDQNSTADFTTP